jgi:glyoxylase-like metal-dependent hydrolase (beta-lactamase superfamily II)
LRRILVIVVLFLGLAFVAAAGGLAWAHMSLRRNQGPLPDLLSAPLDAAVADAPVSVSYINTASQVMPRSAVLDPGSDPSPGTRYVMSHPSFVLRWADGRMMLIDAGMTSAAAADFGRPLELLAEAEPMQPLTSSADALGAQVAQLGAILFTHLHTDHVDGLTAICRQRREALRVFMTTAQARHGNYTSAPGRAMIEEAGCARIEELPDETLVSVPGFPGVSVFAAGGHTPDTQVILATVGSGGGARAYAFLGDVVNHIDGINHNIPKPFLYRLLMVPEDDSRLGALRVMMRRLRDERGTTLLPAHDQLAIEASRLAAYQP